MKRCLVGSSCSLSLIHILTDPRFKILCAANVVFAIGAFEDIHVSFHFVFNWWSDKYQGKRNAAQYLFLKIKKNAACRGVETT